MLRSEYEIKNRPSQSVEKYLGITLKLCKQAHRVLFKIVS